MRNYHEFHDGWFEGLWIDGPRTHVYLSTIAKERFTIVAEDVVALSADDIKTGNIIFEVLTRTHEELNEDDIAILPELQMIDASQKNIPLERAHQQKLMILEINPSYGGSCLILARSFDLMDRSEWLERYLPASQ
jgi:hypothetical protein